MSSMDLVLRAWEEENKYVLARLTALLKEIRDWILQGMAQSIPIERLSLICDSDGHEGVWLLQLPCTV